MARAARARREVGGRVLIRGPFEVPAAAGVGEWGEGARWTAGAGPGCRRDAGRQRGGGTPVRTGVPSGTASTAEPDGGVNGPVGADQLSTVALPVGSGTERGMDQCRRQPFASQRHLACRGPGGERGDGNGSTPTPADV